MLNAIHDPLVFGTRTVSSFPYTVVPTDSIIYAAGSGARTITLLASVNAMVGQRLKIKDISTAGGALTVAAAGSDLIEGSASIAAYDIVELIWNGTEWVSIEPRPINAMLTTCGENPGAFLSAAANANISLQAANDAVLVAIRPSRSYYVTKLSFSTGTLATGNYDVGIYDSAGTLLGSKGTTVLSGTTTEIVSTLTAPVRLRRGKLYYIAIALSDVTSQIRGITTLAYAPLRDPAGNFMCLRVTSSFPLPSTITLGNVNALRFPVMLARED